MPYFKFSTETHGEIPARGGEGERSNRRPEGEVVEDYPVGDVRQDGLTVFVDGQEKVASGCEAKSCDVLPMRERQCVGLVTIDVSAGAAKVTPRWGQDMSYSTRSKTVTRLPTGE